MNVCIGKDEARERDIPVAYLNFNGSPPVGDKTPSLMTFERLKLYSMVRNIDNSVITFILIFDNIIFVYTLVFLFLTYKS